MQFLISLLIFEWFLSYIRLQCLQSRYGLITPMAKTLHEDPSCQLCNILKKYLLLSSNVEQYLKDDVPHLSILRQVNFFLDPETGTVQVKNTLKNFSY